MILIAGTIRFPAKTMVEARQAMAQMIAATRGEDGCIQYAFAEDVLDPGLIHISEVWRDQPALDRHRETEHMVAWRAAGKTFGVGDRDLRYYDVQEPVQR